MAQNFGEFTLGELRLNCKETFLIVRNEHVFNAEVLLYNTLNPLSHIMRLQFRILL